MLSYAPAHAPVMGMTSDQPSGIHPIRVLYGSILGHFDVAVHDASKWRFSLRQSCGVSVVSAELVRSTFKKMVGRRHPSHIHARGTIHHALKAELAGSSFRSEIEHCTAKPNMVHAGLMASLA